MTDEPETYVQARAVSYVDSDGVVRHRMCIRETAERFKRWTGGLSPLPPVESRTATKVVLGGEPAVKLETTGTPPEAVEGQHAADLTDLRTAVVAGDVQPTLFDVATMKGKTGARPIDLRPERRRAPKPTTTPFSGWVAWVSPGAGEERRGIVTGSGKERLIIPADGGEMLRMRTGSVKSGEWQVKDGEHTAPLRVVPGPAGEQDALFNAEAG
ncbi:hypothetical protein [Kitasatospora purpeofusca]|uniref:hypothetical protein n=1 Tax=Kitasatospora purpeofusca TaxID=67352 RepID=UPI0036B52093